MDATIKLTEDEMKYILATVFQVDTASVTSTNALGLTIWSIDLSSRITESVSAK